MELLKQVNQAHLRYISKKLKKTRNQPFETKEEFINSYPEYRVKEAFLTKFKIEDEAEAELFKICQKMATEIEEYKNFIRGEDEDTESTSVEEEELEYDETEYEPVVEGADASECRKISVWDVLFILLIYIFVLNYISQNYQ